MLIDTILMGKEHLLFPTTLPSSLIRYSRQINLDKQMYFKAYELIRAPSCLFLISMQLSYVGTIDEISFDYDFLFVLQFILIVYTAYVIVCLNVFSLYVFLIRQD